MEFRRRSSSISVSSIDIFATDFEKLYNKRKLSIQKFPLVAKIILYLTLFAAILLRILLLIDSYIGTCAYDSLGELRLTITFLGGCLLEFIVFFFPNLEKIKGIFILMTCMYHIIDSSCFYYPDEIALVPSAIFLIPSCFIIGFLYTYNWVSATVGYILSGLGFLIRGCIAYEFTAFEGISFFGEVCVFVFFTSFICYLNEQNIKKLIQIEIKHKKNFSSFNSMLQHLADGVVLRVKEKITFFNESLKLLFTNIDNNFKVAAPQTTFAFFLGKANRGSEMNVILMVSKVEQQINKDEYREYFQSRFDTKSNEILEVDTGKTLKNYLNSRVRTLNDISQKLFVYEGYCSQNKKLYFEIKTVKIIHGDNICQAVIFRDITSIKELEEKREAEKYQKCFVASVTHDLRTPLNGILAIIESMAEEASSSQIRLIELIRNTGMMMLYLINDVLDFAQIEAKKLSIHPEEINIREMINEVVELMKFNFSQKNIGLRLEIFEKAPETLTTDPKRYRQILFNLLGNALKFTSEGFVLVSVLFDEECKKLITSVKDTGCGLSEEELPHLFQLFGRISRTEARNTNGVGLGLHISKMLSEILGGSIYAESELGKGTTFTFFIDSFLTQKSVEKSQEKYCEECMNVVSKRMKEERKNSTQLLLVESESGTPSILLKNTTSHKPFSAFQKEKIKCNCPQILVVDDTQINQLAIGTILKSMGLVADYSGNGKEAIEKIKLRSKQECCTKYAIVFMDLSMPVMGGREANKCIQGLVQDSKIPYTPIVALSATTFDEVEVAEMMDQGFESVLEKPISKARLISEVKHYVSLY